MKARYRACVAAGLCLAATLPSQSRNVRLLSLFKPAGVIFTDVWGYVSNAGREYVIAGSRSGTFFLDVTDPASPVQRGFIPSSASGWGSNVRSDIKTYRHYAYVVTEGGGGMQIVDLSDPDNPRLLKTWGDSIWTHTHNLGLDVQQGVAFACGTNVGMPVIDLRTDPENPRVITTYTDEYVHDITVQDGLAHQAEINRGQYRLVDLTRLPQLPSLGTATVRKAHNAWPTRDNAYAVTTSEDLSTPGILRVFDIRTRTAPALIATYSVPGANRSAHNAYLIDRVVYMSYYSEGFRCVDLSDPTSPLEVGFYDTDGPSSGFRGGWGCYPFLPSGTMILTSRDLNAGSSVGGLYVLDAKASAARYGDATPGSSGAAPAIHTFGSAYLGNASFQMQLEDARANSPALLLLGSASANRVVGGFTLLVDLLGAVTAHVGTTGGSGSLSAPLPVPNDASLNGLVLHAQFFVVDAGIPGGVAASRGLRFELFAP